MAGQPLAVPMQLDALVVNQGVLARDSFRWWQFNYQSLGHWRSPEPLALDRAIGGQQQGVYLSWTLPDALRHSGPDAAPGEYPLVPNRWMIVRMNGTAERQAAAWVLESDCPFTSAVTTSSSANASMYLADPALVTQWKASPDPIRSATTLTPSATTVQVTKLGVSFPLAQWSERAGQGMFLSAVAPSNPLFSTFVAHNLGVFSFYDDLKGIDSDTLSYFVLGWYSDPTQDVLAPASGGDAAYAALLAELNWALAGGSQAAAVQSVYHGAAFSIGWQRTGDPPSPDALQANRDKGTLNVGVGNTTIDAFTALIGQQLNDPAKARLLRAFQYDFLQQLNQVNGDALLDEAIRQAWFGSRAGGYSWAIVRDSSDGDTGTALTTDEEAWLLALNQAQAALDAALTRLYSLQWDLHALWLKNGYLSDGANTFPSPPSGVGSLTDFQAQLAAGLDPTHAGSTAAQLVAQFGVVQQLLPQVPQPVWTGTTNAQQALQNGILAFAKAKLLDPAKTLKAVAAPRYWQANNPVVVVSGVDARSAVSTDALPVRPADALVTGFTVAGGPVAAGAVSGLMGLVQNLAAVPSAAAGPLLQEFMLLDPANAAAIAQASGQPQAQVSAAMQAHDPAAYQGTLPAVGLGPWQQPWSPMFLEWSGTYAYLPYQSGGTPAWTFDGTEYRLTAPVSGLTVEKRNVGGISLLSPHASFVFGSRLQKFVQQYGTATELAQIDQWIATVYGWQFLAQELTGFHQWLSLRDTRAFRRPSAADQVGGFPVAALTGYGDGVVPPQFALPPSSQGQVNDVPFLTNAPTAPFHGTRQGAFYFTDFYLYDRFGRTLFVIQSGQSSGVYDYTNFPVLIDDALLPDETVVPGVNSVLQLPPRLLQHARLDVRLLDAVDDTKVYGSDAGAMPISGWVLPNHLDGSILVFAPDGTAMGEFRLYAQADGSKLGQWQPPPHSTLTMDDVGTAAPHLRAMLESPRLAQEAGFQAFLAAIDETLWTTDPLGNRADANLSVLVGRPLALLRTRLQFQLDGEPIGDTGWAATFSDATPEFLGFPFSIRLGDQRTRQDGVIGYFSGDDYDVFNSTVAPEDAAQPYVTPIGPVGGTTPGNYLGLTFAPDTYQKVTVLADPRAAIHAYTGILPVKRCDVPQAYVDAALQAMEISFQMGPLLTVLGPTPGTGSAPPAYPQSIVYPTPAEQNGSWSWWERNARTGAWTGYGLAPASPNAQDPDAPASLREGSLQFITNLGT